MAAQVSIVMAMRNNERTLQAALRSILDQSYRDWEMILLDDGSADESVRIARTVRDPRVHVVVDGQWRGLPARLNQGLALASGKYVARMDADDVSYAERLERQVAFLEAHPEVDLAGTRAIVFEDGGAVLGLLPFAGRHDQICARPWRGFPLPHPTWMGRRAWFVRFRYREQAVRCEDQDLLLRAHRASRFACLPEVLLGYRQNSLSLRNTLLGRRSYADSLWQVERNERGIIPAFASAVAQGAMAAVALGAVGLGLRRRMLLRRFCAVSPRAAAEWGERWQAINEPADQLRECAG